MLTVAERETRLSMTGDDHGTWDVFTDDPFWIARLDKIATAWKVNGGRPMVQTAGRPGCGENRHK